MVDYIWACEANYKYSIYGDSMQHATLNGIDGVGEVTITRSGKNKIVKGCFLASDPSEASRLLLDSNVFRMKFEGVIRDGLKEMRRELEVNMGTQPHGAENGKIYFDVSGDPSK